MLKKCYSFLSIKSINIILSLRTLSTCPTIFNKRDFRECRQMRKFLNHSPSKRKAWYESSKAQGQSVLPVKTTVSEGGRNYRRVAVLNKLFMKHITDQMATSSIASEIVHRGIEISKVKVAPDITRVTVYWLAKGSKHDEDTENILTKYAKQLRHELAQLRLIGNVPVLNFVKDKSYNRLVDIDQRLAVADFGEDYIPTDPSHHLKTEFILNTQFSQRMKDALESCQVDSDEKPLPQMRTDVLGVNQQDIMTKVKKMMKKSEAPHRMASGELLLDSDHTLIPTECPSENMLKVTSNITEHFLRQQLQKQKCLRGPKNYQPEKDLQASYGWSDSDDEPEETDTDEDIDHFTDIEEGTEK